MQLALYSAVHISFLKGQLLKESTFLELLCGLEMRKREEYHHLSSEDMLAFASPCCSVHTSSTCHTLLSELEVLNYFPFLSKLCCFLSLFHWGIWVFIEGMLCLLSWNSWSLCSIFKLKLSSLYVVRWCIRIVLMVNT